MPVLAHVYVTNGLQVLPSSARSRECRKDQSQSNILLSPEHHLDSLIKVSWSYEHQCHPDRICAGTSALKASRCVEIERQAMQIEPPLLHNLLVHMPCFQTATQATAALDDNAWNILLLKLLAERTDAERAENVTLSKLFKGPDTSLETKDGALKEVADKDWDDIQGPARARMSDYSDDIIRTSWVKGRKVNKENST
ncbi:hypothetical protein LX36DRAFT_204246 [Colletotrichum falcatum]|nr:hypothetical protein LX36DRAFT_204246 [Colletotrichum falcatum]